MRKVVVCLTTAAVLSACVSAPEPVEEMPNDTLQYPVSPVASQPSQVHGVPVTRYFPWLEDTNTMNTKQWVDAQNQLSTDYLSSTDAHSSLRNTLPQHWNYERHSAPVRHGRFYFYWRNDGLQNHAALYVREGLQGVPRRILDPNTFSRDGFVSIGDVSISPDARYVAYSLLEAGSEWPELRIRDTRTGHDLEDRINATKEARVSWLNDGSGFYYSRYPETPGGQPDANQSVAIYFHRLGSAQRNDRRIYDLSAYPGWNPYPQVTRDGRFLIAHVERDDEAAANAVHVLDLTARNARWQPLLTSWDGHYEFIGSDANLLFFKTNVEAENGRIVALDVQRPDAAHWQELVPEQTATLHEARYVGGKFIVHYRQREQSQLTVYNAYGRYESSIEIPDGGNVQQLSGQASHLEAFFYFDSPTVAGTTYHYDVAEQALTVVEQSQLNLDLSGYETSYIELPGANEQPAILRITSPHGRDSGRAYPTLLTVEEPLQKQIPSAFSASHIAWLERGGVVATLITRTPLEQQLDAAFNTHYSALMAATEHLLKQHSATPDTLVLQGTGTAAWVINQALIEHPEQFAAALSHAPIADALSGRAAALMTPLESAQEVEERLAMSPLHRLMERNSTLCLPPTLITASATSSSAAAALEPWQSYKWAAALQTRQGCQQPVLLKVTADADESQAQPTWVRIERALDQLSFAFEQLQSNAQSSNLNSEP